MTGYNAFANDGGLYDFESTDTFLDSISSALPPFSPSSSSGEEQYNNFNNDPSINFSNNNFDPNYYPDNNEIVNEDFINPNIENNNNLSNTLPNNNDDLFSQVISSDITNGDSTNFNNTYNNLQASAMSTTSYSNDSSSNGVTPISQPSVSSAHTSPESHNNSNVKLEQTNTNLFVDDDDSTTSPQSKNGLKKSPKTTAKITKPPKKDKTSHNMIEKKYRTNINSKILVLRDAVPSLRIAAGNGKISIAELEGLTPAAKLNKASVLTKATEYIKHLEQKNEVLKNQNIQLQRLIQEASLRPMPQQLQQQHQQFQQHQPQSSSPPNQQQYGGFGFVPNQNETSYNTTPVQHSYSGNVVYDNHNINPNNNYGSNYPPSNANTNQNANSNSNTSYLLGGMAAVMGTSLLTGDGGDFQGLSSLPFAHFLPYSLTHPSSISIKLFNLLRVSLFIVTIATLLYPTLAKLINGRTSEKHQQRSANNVWVSWLLVNLGLQLPNNMDKERKSAIIARLLGQQEFSWSSLISDYVFLSASETNFENVFLNLIIGTLLINKFPFASRVVSVNLSLKGSLITNLDYKGDDKSLAEINKLIKNLDGISILGSTSLIERLINLASHKPINADVNDGQNHLKYVEIYQENSNDFYGLILSWRILEITHQLTVTFLKTISSKKQSDDVKNKLYEQIKGDSTKLGELLGDSNTRVAKYFRLFNGIINPSDAAFSLLKEVESDVAQQLSVFKIIREGQELTDHEIVDTSDEEAEGNSDANSGKEVHQESSIETISSQKSLISSLNLVSEEQFIVLTSSLILSYKAKGDQSKAQSLLKHLKLEKKNIGISLLSFTALLKVINEMTITFDDDSDDEGLQATLDQLVRVTRLWVNDDKKKFFLNDNLRGNISDLIVAKGMILDGVDSTNDDDE